LPVTDYLLYVSTLDVYKAQLEVVEAYGLLKKKGLRSEKLVLVGPEYKPYAEKVRNKIAELGLQEDVLIVGNVPHTDLPSAYRNARINIFASETENCPFILLEALGAGRPVLVSSCPPMPEFGGDAVVYFDPSRPEDLARKLEQVNSDEELMLRLAGAASERSAQYRWEETGRKTWDAFVDLLEVPRDVEATTF
jgi:glycosyltransferase involved in cell wall biosynthesis